MENNYSIQEYQEEDVEEMIALGARMHQEGAYHFLPYQPERLRQLDREIRVQNRQWGNGWTAKYQGKIIGMYVAYISYYFFNSEKTASDYFFYIDPDYRNRWPMMAIKLVKCAERWAKEQGCKEFAPATSVLIAPKVSKIYEFLKYDVVGNFFKKTLQ